MYIFPFYKFKNFEILIVTFDIAFSAKKYIILMKYI